MHHTNKPFWQKGAAALLALALAFSVSFALNDYDSAKEQALASSQSSTSSLTTQERLDALLARGDQSGDGGGTSGTANSSGTSGTSANGVIDTTANSVTDGAAVDFTAADIPAYSGELSAIINGNTPFFSKADLTTDSFESYCNLDFLGRCGTATACIGLDIMPTEDRGSISSVTPSGWVQASYDTDVVPGGYLYNRAHLIGFQLTGENANKENLITGTQAFNVSGMLPFENTVADYVQETGNHVYYRVTPIFDGSDLVAQGVLIEAQSVEDGGAGVKFNVFCYNVQYGILIDYASGESWAVR